MILLVNGSPRIDSNSALICNNIQEHVLGNKYSEIEYIDLQNFILPLFDGSKEQREIKEIYHLEKLFTQADFVIIVTPEYHKSISGTLKNLCDHLNRNITKGKKSLIMSVSGSEITGSDALYNLKTILKGLEFDVLPEQLIFTPKKYEDQKVLLDYMTKIDELISNYLSD